MNQDDLRAQITEFKERRTLYLQREKEMLTGGAQSYGTGRFSLSRYQTDLNAVRMAIKEMDDEIKTLESQFAGKSVRKAIGVVPCDW